MTDHRLLWVVVAILAIALIARVALIAATPDFRPRIDAWDYDRLATSIADGHGYGKTNIARPGSPAALWPPAYPHLLAAAYVVKGDHSWNPGRVLGALLGTLAVLLLYLIARQVAGVGTALVAAAIAAVFPPLIMLNASIISEALFVPLELASVFAVLVYRRHPARLRWAMLAGVLCGLAALTRSVGVLLLVPAAIGLWTARPVQRPRLLAPVIAVAVAVAVVSPWTLRNAGAFDAFVPISTQAGPTAAGTYNSETDTHGPLYAVYRPANYVKQFAPLFHHSLDEAQLDSRLRSSAWDYVVHHPDYAVIVTALNTLRTLDIGPGHTTLTNGNYKEMGIPHALRRLTTFSLWAIVGLAAIGLAVGRRPLSFRNRFVWLVPALTYLGAIVITGGERYRAPADPFLVLLAAVGLVGVVRWVSRRDGSSASPETKSSSMEPLAVRKP